MGKRGLQGDQEGLQKPVNGECSRPGTRAESRVFAAETKMPFLASTALARARACYSDFVRVIVSIKYTGDKTHSLGKEYLPF